MPTCAEDATSLDSEERRCTSESPNAAVDITPTITIEFYTTHIYNTDSVTSMVTSSEIPLKLNRQQNMVWVYGLMTVFLLVIIVLVLSLIFVSISKCSIYHNKNRVSII
jgi:ATP-dependent Zn protease